MLMVVMLFLAACGSAENQIIGIWRPSSGEMMFLGQGHQLGVHERQFIEFFIDGTIVGTDTIDFGIAVNNHGIGYTIRTYRGGWVMDGSRLRIGYNTYDVSFSNRGNRMTLTTGDGIILTFERN